MKNRACRAMDGDGKKVHAKTEIAKDCKNWESVSERERDQRWQTKTSREGRMRESVRQRGTNRYRDSWTAEIRRTRGSDCPLSPPLPRHHSYHWRKSAMFYPLPSAYQWFSINHSPGSMCLGESALSVRLTTTMQPAYTTPKDRGDIHAQERTRVRSKPYSSSVQWHSSHSKRTLLINSIRSHRQRDRLMERYPDVALQHHISARLCHLPFFFFLSSFHPTLCPSLSPRQVPGRTAMKMSKVPPLQTK